MRDVRDFLSQLPNQTPIFAFSSAKHACDMKIDRPEYLGSSETSGERLNVLIAYDDAEAYNRARRMFSELAHEFGKQVHFLEFAWRFDVLADPSCDQFTLLDGIRAHLLIVSTSGEVDLPLAVQRWIIACLDGRFDGIAALIALFGKHGHIEPDNSPRLEFLNKGGQRCKFNRFPSSAGCERPLLAIAAPTRSQAESVSQLIEHMLHPSFSSWR